MNGGINTTNTVTCFKHGKIKLITAEECWKQSWKNKGNIMPL